MTRDWVDWHEGYDVAESSLARRLVVVRRYLSEALAAAPPPVRLLSICAGDGRDVLPVLASYPAGREVHAVLVELTPELADRARAAAADLDLPAVEVRTADAGATATYAALEPADILLACGVFGNVTHEDMCRTVAALPALTTPGATVIWTRGRRPDADPSQEVRAQFRAEGFTELAFTAPGDARFRVGMSRRPPNGGTALPSEPRLFTFR
ncbi:class I SAM-dependent methyltransferase family protein [Actinoplanes sp. KI2]|uniref:class I SAM-dependent methyltransferase family protein n=1 Tax=Actinoplanes sp. KI2 TaxID=2983315 RepID=UPI0021D58456|nr:class I SAM-dependent methyltransferase family protein [Actinoplanes sp. KI2]MCU7728705.1 class I SAM-dependent methyltransferase family protein [Actinoplanes sp. KI2]